MPSSEENIPTLPRPLQGSASRPGLRNSGPRPSYLTNLTKTATQAIQTYFSQHEGRCAEPGEEWTLLPEVPSAAEIMGSGSPDDSVYLAPNLIDGPWESSAEYLKTHYNLIREDAVAPLRDAVAFVRNAPTMADTKDVSIYDKVYITRCTLTQRGVAFRIQFSTTRAGKKILWQFSSRLITGSIVVLSPATDSFRSKCIVATVAARPLENVQKSPPEVDLFFAETSDVSFDPHQEWTMVEARSGYFEAYRHTMTALQKLSTEKFPLSNHICGLDPDIKAPEHVQSSPLMNLGGLSRGTFISDRRLNVLESFPSTPGGSLDEFQWHALQQILTKKLAIVQGPPGTGKTFVSVIALRILLANMSPEDPPIIISSQTNHALDQLISQVSRFEKNYVRIGGRSTDGEIRKKTLFAIRSSQPDVVVSGGLWGSARNEMRKLENEIVDLLRPFSSETFGSHMMGSAFIANGLLTEGQMNSLTRGASWIGGDTEKPRDPFANWLGDRCVDTKVNYPDFEFHENEIDEEYEKLGQIEAGQSNEYESWELLRGKFVNLAATFYGKKSRNLLSQTAIQGLLLNEDLWKIPIMERGAVYNQLRSRLVEIIRRELQGKVKRYMQCCHNMKMGRWEKDHQILKGAKLVAMTMTGLSKYRGLISSLEPRIVLIEEAAEVIEGHVVTACFKSLQQLILVGDHQQLRAQCSVQNLGGDPFYLDTSMFERLVKNNMPFIVLREQRRMAPEIRRLLGQFYGDLHDHVSVQNYQSVPGMGYTRSLFYTHDWPESGDSLMSRVNEIEAVMVVDFYNYLLLNEIPPERITIVTFYNGQRKLILKILKSGPYTQYHQPKVTTVDSYQGEENDIIILSLVRSTGSRGVGFLSNNNRICVALSRAKQGLFIFGNGMHLSDASQAWRNIIATMDARQDFLDVLPVTCSKHGITTGIRVPGDWKEINGGCSRLCREKLRCGHLCPLPCHGFPHTWVKCPRDCEEVPVSMETQTAPERNWAQHMPARQRSSTQSQWMKFAQGGVRESDAHFQTLSRAKDASSAEVQTAMAKVDTDVAPLQLRDVGTGKENEGMHPGGVPVGILIEYEA